MLSVKEILQIDATVLAGLLILTTIIPLEISNSVQNIWTSQSSWAFWVGWGFSLSAIFAICASVVDEKKRPEIEKKLRFLSMGFMLTGFIFLVIIFFVIGEFRSLVNTGVISMNKTSP